MLKEDKKVILTEVLVTETTADGKVCARPLKISSHGEEKIWGPLLNNKQEEVSEQLVRSLRYG